MRRNRKNEPLNEDSGSFVKALVYLIIIVSIIVLAIQVYDVIRQGRRAGQVETVKKETPVEVKERQIPRSVDLSDITGLEKPRTPFDDALQIVEHPGFILAYYEPYEQAAWVGYELTAEELDGKVMRTDNFRADPKVATGSATDDDYKYSGYDRGHLVPAADLKWDEKAMNASFYMSNVSPQKHEFNAGIWLTLEQQIRQWARENGAVIIVTGPVLKPGLPVIGKNEVAVPEYFFKVVLDFRKPGLKAIGFILKNEKADLPLPAYSITVDSVESFTGYDFFYPLPDTMEERLEGTIGNWTFAPL